MKRTPAMTAAGSEAISKRESSGAKSIKADREGVVNDIIDAALATIPQPERAPRGFRYYQPDDNKYFRVVDFAEMCVAMCVDEVWAERIVFILNNNNRS